MLEFALEEVILFLIEKYPEAASIRWRDAGDYPIHFALEWEGPSPAIEALLQGNPNSDEYDPYVDLTDSIAALLEDLSACLCKLSLGGHYFVRENELARALKGNKVLKDLKLHIAAPLE